jgi:predicted small metal-binding protein
MPSFKCKDIGMSCSFEIKDDNQDELMSIVALHADKTHNIKQVSPELADKIKKAIKK